MRKLVTAASVAAMALGLTASSAMASEHVERADDPFVCPVLNVSDNATANSDQFIEIGEGDTSILPGKAGTEFNGNVPNGATNGDGSGSPGGAHSSPGDTDYTAIWSGN